MKNWFKMTFSLLTCVLVAGLNQNCGGQSAFEAEELASIHDPSILDVDQPSSKARVGDRVFIASVLSEVFLPQNGDARSKAEAVAIAGNQSALIYRYIRKPYKTEDKAITNIIINNVLEKVSEFHGNCSFVDEDSTCALRNNSAGRTAQSETQTIAPSTVTREGYRTSACKKIIGVTRAVRNLVGNVTGDRTSKFSEGSIMGVYDLFYPGQKIDEESYDALVDVSRIVLASGKNDVDVWRSVIIPICYSAGWQIP
ncbi:MAG: hypothetical protein ACRBBP_05635 [Bdellovibrionales bacterium]